MKTLIVTQTSWKVAYFFTYQMSVIRVVDVGEEYMPHIMQITIETSIW